MKAGITPDGNVSGTGPFIAVEVNSGELGPTSKKDREELAKKAAEATVNVAAEGEGESGDAAPTEEKADAGSDGAAADDIEF